MRILIIEDEYKLADVIKEKLKQEKYLVDIASDGYQGLEMALNSIYNLIILDVMLPKMDGFEILKRIREEEIDTRIIMLTAKSELEDKLNGFYKGADDYITKPFHLEELLARVNVQLRKNNKNQITDYLKVGDLKLDLKTSTLTCITTNEKIDIGCKEFLLLEYLIQNKNQVLTKDQIYTKIWGLENEIESNNLEAYLSFIRKKLKIIGSKVTIKAIRGLGYKIEG